MMKQASLLATTPSVKVDAFKISEINPDKGVQITGKVIEEFGLPNVDDGPLGSLFTSRKRHAVTICHENSMIDIFFYDVYATKLGFLSSGDSITIHGLKRIVYPANPIRNVANDSFKRNFVPYCIGIEHFESSSSSKSSAFWIKVKGTRISNGEGSVTITDDTIDTIEIPLRPIFNIHNSDRTEELPRNPESSSPPPSAKRSKVEMNSPAETTNFMDEYLTLQQASTSIGHDVNVYAMVISFTGIKLTRGNDRYCETLCLLDQSQPNSQYPIILNLFSNDIDAFPKIRHIGDLLRIKKVRTQIHSGKLQLVGNVGYQHKEKATSILVIHKKIDPITGCLSPSTSLTAVSSSSSSSLSVSSKETMNFGLRSDIWDVRETIGRTYSYHSSETQIVEKLHQWGQEFLFQHPLVYDIPDTKLVNSNHLLQRRFFGTTTNLPTLGPRCDIIGIILDVEPLRDMTIPATVTIWDGTIPSEYGSITIHPEQSDDTNNNDNSNGSDSSNHNYYKSVLAYRCSKIYAMSREYSSIDLLCIPHIQKLISEVFVESSLRGCGIKLITIGEYANISIACLSPGMWVRFRNLHINYDSLTTSTTSSMATNDSEHLKELICTTPVATIYGDTHVCPLLPMYYDTKRIASRIEELVQDHPIRPPRPARPTISRKGHPYSPLALCLTSIAPAKFCVVGRILSYWPSNVESFVTSVSGNSSLFFTIRIGDDTAICDVIFLNEDAEFFLHTTTNHFESSVEYREKVLTRLQETIHNKTSMDFYIQSFYSLGINTLRYK